MKIINISLSAPEQSVMGKALFNFYYRNNDGLEDLIKTSGRPHNGGEHSLVISGTKDNLEAWLDLFLEKYPTVNNEINKLKNELNNYTGQGMIRLY